MAASEPGNEPYSMLEEEWRELIEMHQACANVGKYSDAIKHGREALRVCESMREYGRSAKHEVFSLLSIGAIERELDLRTAAQASFRAAIEIAEIGGVTSKSLSNEYLDALYAHTHARLGVLLAEDGEQSKEVIESLAFGWLYFTRRKDGVGELDAHIFEALIWLLNLLLIERDYERALACSMIGLNVCFEHAGAADLLTIFTTDVASACAKQVGDKRSLAFIRAELKRYKVDPYPLGTTDVFNLDEAISAAFVAYQIAFTPEDPTLDCAP